MCQWANLERLKRYWKIKFVFLVHILTYNIYTACTVNILCPKHHDC